MVGGEKAFAEVVVLARRSRPAGGPCARRSHEAALFEKTGPTCSAAYQRVLRLWCLEPTPILGPLFFQGMIAADDLHMFRLCRQDSATTCRV